MYIFKDDDELYVWCDGFKQQDSKQVLQAYSEKIKNRKHIQQ